MQFEPFLLDEWLERKFSGCHIRHDFSASSGPGWTIRELLKIAGVESHEDLFDLAITYPSAEGSLELRTAIAEFEGVSPHHVQIVTGAQEALLAIFFHAARPGANVILPQPGFPPFSALPKGLGLDVRHYVLRPENGFQLDLDEVKRLVDGRTALILVNSPHNPTGAVISEEQRRHLHDFCAARGIQFVCDQLFHPHYYIPAPPSAASLEEATVVGDFSKALCMPGLRIGWIVDRRRDRLEKYREARMYFTISNSPVTEWLAALAMKHRHVIDTRARDVSVANLEIVESVWRGDTRLEWVRPQGGFTIFPRLRGVEDARPLCERLGERGLFVVPGDCFGMPSHIRVGFGSQHEHFAEGFQELNAELKTYFSETSRRSVVVVPS
jgi:aspartate/methionine/tyrosine aminotransferase